MVVLRGAPLAMRHHLRPRLVPSRNASMSTLTQALQRLHRQGFASDTTGSRPEVASRPDMNPVPTMVDENVANDVPFTLLGPSNELIVDPMVSVSHLNSSALGTSVEEASAVDFYDASRIDERFAILESAVENSVAESEALRIESTPFASFQTMLTRINRQGEVTSPAPSDADKKLERSGWMVEEIIAKALEIESESEFRVVSPRQATQQADEITDANLEYAYQFAAQLAADNEGLLVDLLPNPQAMDTSSTPEADVLDESDVEHPDYIVPADQDVPRPKRRTSRSNDTPLDDTMLSEIPFIVPSEQFARAQRSPDQEPLDDIERLMQELESEMANEPTDENSYAIGRAVELSWDSPPRSQSGIEAQGPSISSPTRASVPVPVAAPLERSVAIQRHPLPPLPELPAAMAEVRREPMLWEGYKRLGDQIDHDLPIRGAGSLMIFGTGKEPHVTDVVLQLAYQQAEGAMRRVVVVDGNITQKSLSKRFGITDHPGLGELANQMTEWDRVTVGTPHERLFVVGAGHHRGADSVDEVTLLSVIMELSNNFDLVIVDAGDGGSPYFSALYNACDCSYMLARLGRTRRELILKQLQNLRDSNLVPTACIVTNAPAAPRK